MWVGITKVIKRSLLVSWIINIIDEVYIKRLIDQQPIIHPLQENHQIVTNFRD